MDWIIANWASVVAIVTGVVTVASIIAKLTPTQTDDKIVAYVLKIVDVLALNTKPKEIKK